MYIDFIIIGVFLAVILATGLYYGKGIKTFQAYAVGSRKMSDFVITISLIATTYGGGILVSRLDDYYRQGFYMLIMDLASPINFFLASRFMVPRMKEFMGHFSIAESMGSIYGPMVRVLTGILGIMMSIALLASQFKVGLIIATTLYPEAEQFSNYLTAILALLVISYSTFGGARAVALTDVYQFFLFGICFPILVVMVLYHTQNPLVGWQKLIAIPQFNVEKVLMWNDALTAALAYFIWRSVFPFDPARIQRFYMASSVQQATRVFSNSAIIRVLFSILGPLRIV